MLYSVSSHLKTPFQVTVEDPHTKTTNLLQLTRREKITSIALGILIGLVTAGIGGVLAFYLISGYFKNRHIEQLSPVKPLPPKVDNPRIAAADEIKELLMQLTREEGNAEEIVGRIDALLAEHPSRVRSAPAEDSDESRLIPKIQADRERLIALRARLEGGEKDPQFLKEVDELIAQQKAEIAEAFLLNVRMGRLCGLKGQVLGKFASGDGVRTQFRNLLDLMQLGNR